ncbi:MAG TPA: TolC family protein, partial [Paraburkholderia sp.]
MVTILYRIRTLMPARRSLALLLCAGVMTGCAVGPDYRRPEVALPDHYMGQAAVEQRQAAARADLATWWEGFDDPLLTRFVALALAQNLDLVQATARVKEARAGLGAANAALLPSGTVSAS